MDSNARATNRRWGPSDTWDEGPEEKKRKQSWRSLSDLVGGGDDAALQAGGPSSEKGGAGRSQDAEERAGTSAGGGKRNGTVRKRGRRLMNV